LDNSLLVLYDDPDDRPGKPDRSPWYFLGRAPDKLWQEASLQVAARLIPQVSTKMDTNV
jgi:hypothetical protein